MQTSDQINLVIAIATLLSALASLFVAVLTNKIAKSNQLTAELMKAELYAAARPYIQIGLTIQIGTPFIQLNIANIGQSNAVDLRLELDKNFYFNAHDGEQDNLRTYTAFTHPISTFSPKSQLVFGLGTGSVIFKNAQKCPHRFDVKATYKHNGTEIEEVTLIDLQPFQRAVVPHDPIADEIERLRKSVEKISNELRKTH
jgi:hypothetical protein